MAVNRRQFLSAAAGAAVAAGRLEPTSAAPEPDFSEIRRNFPRALNEVYFNCAAQYPVGNHAAAGIQRYLDFMRNGPGPGRTDFWEEGFREIAGMFARLINAKPSEVTFTPSTTLGENTVVEGLDLRGGNVVTNDLHYGSSLFNYKMRERAGLDVRIVKNRDWQIDVADMEKAVDRNTRLISVSLVSSVNGHREQIEKLSELAHSHGAYLFADIIQAAGAVPIDVRAMGIDFASCGQYKWLMGEHGFGFLYVREDLQGSVLKPTQFGGSVDLNYPPWTEKPQPGSPEVFFKPPSNVSMYYSGTPSVITFAATYESLKYIEKLGIGNIRRHTRKLTDRFQKELPALGYPAITPPGTESGIVTFLLKDAEETKSRLTRAAQTGKAKISFTGPNSALTVGRFGNQLRISVGVYNNDSDVDKLLEILA